MSYELAELARQSFYVYNAETSGNFQALREQLNSELGSLAVTNYIEAERQAKANFQFVTSVVGLLPDLRGLPDQAAAKFLQQSTVWQFTGRKTNTGSPIHHPTYVVGGYKGSLGAPNLLTCWGLDLRKMPVGRIRHALLKKNQQENLGRAYTDRQLKEIYDISSDTFNLSSHSPGSKRLNNDRWHSLRLSRSLNKLPAELFLKADVFSHLSKLAVLFNVQNEFDALLAGSEAFHRPLAEAA